MRRSAAHGLPFDRALDLRRRLARLQARGDRQHVAQRGGPSAGPGAAATRPARAARGSATVARRRSRATSASTKPQTWRSADGAAAASTSSTPIARPLAVLERELLELAQQALLALADVRRRAPARRPRRGRCPAGRASAGDPARQVLGLQRLLLRDVAAGRLHGGHELRGHLDAALLAREERDGRRSGMSFSSGASAASTSASFQRSTPSTIRKRRPIANVIALSAEADVLRRRRVALEHLDAAAARLRPRRARAAARGARRSGRGRRRG